ncbi:MAG: hypothetical protein JW798_01300 [Prolixibacteraceae bacterium]|nr:hypothetical protein [Prolixibacteraceae bacterium]
MKNRQSNRYLKLVTGILICAIMIYYLAIIASAPQRKLRHLEKETLADSVFVLQHSNFLADSGLFELAKTRAFLESRLLLSRSDSFSLAINLNDSTVNLSYKGIYIQSSKFEILEKDPFFDALRPIVMLKLFSTPLAVFYEKTSIVKEPIVVKKAPKDTIEAMNSIFMPDTLIQNPAYLIIGIDHDINIIMLQEKWLTKTEKKVWNKYLRIRNRLRFSDYFKNVFHPFKPHYSPTIVMSMDVNEIRSIYRALPVKAQVVIGF